MSSIPDVPKEVRKIIEEVEGKIPRPLKDSKLGRLPRRIYNRLISEEMSRHAQEEPMTRLLTQTEREDEVGNLLANLKKGVMTTHSPSTREVESFSGLGTIGKNARIIYQTKTS